MQNDYGIGVQSTLSLFALKKSGFGTRLPVHIHTSILELNQEEVTAPPHHKPRVCAVGDQLPHHRPQASSQIRATFPRR